MHNDEIGYPKEHLFLHLIKKGEFRKIVEIGVASGHLTRRILSSVDKITVYYAVDPWKVYIEFYDREPHEHEKQQSYWDSMYEKVVKIGEDFSQLQIMRMTSVSAAKELIKKKDREGLNAKLTRDEIEKRILARVRVKVMDFQKDTNPDVRRHVQADVIAEFYRDVVIPLTKEGEIQYLMQKKIG